MPLSTSMIDTPSAPNTRARPLVARSRSVSGSRSARTSSCSSLDAFVRASSSAEARWIRQNVFSSTSSSATSDASRASAMDSSSLKGPPTRSAASAPILCSRHATGIARIDEATRPSRSGTLTAASSLPPPSAVASSALGTTLFHADCALTLCAA